MILFLCLSVSFVVSCNKEDVQPTTTINEGEHTFLEVGETAYFEAGDFEIVFGALVEDTRCYVGEPCFRAEYATVRLYVVINGVTTNFEICTRKIASLNLENTFVHNNVEFKLVDVTPYPVEYVEPIIIADGCNVSTPTVEIEPYKINLVINSLATPETDLN